jgi:hypothetical protein
MQPHDGKLELLADPASSIHGLLSAPATTGEGIALDDLAEGTLLEIETRHHLYYVKHLGDGRALISGHPEYCPEPVPVDMIGCTWGGNSLRLRFIGKGANLEFWHPVRGLVRTSSVLEVRVLSATLQ